MYARGLHKNHGEVDVFIMYHMLCARTLERVLPVSFALCFAAPVALSAEQVKLAWDANPESMAAGYKLYYGEASGKYHGAVKVGKATVYTLSGLEEGRTYYIAVTAYDDSGQESGFSAEVSYRMPNSTDEDVDQVGEVSAEGNPQVPNATLTPTLVKVWIEAEDGALVVPMELANDESASGGQYLWVPNGRGNVIDPLKPGGEGQYVFERCR